MRIIGADERAAERRGVKIIIAGPTGVGKTSLLCTVSPTSVLFVDGEAGDLAVQDLPLDTLRIDDWPTARNLACRIGGPNASFSPTSCYSQAHYEAVGGPLENLDRYEIIFVDSITAISRLSFRHAEQQPESFSRNGTKDTRAAYGLHAREMLMWLHQLQHTRSKHVVFVGILEKLTDEFNRPLGFQIQMEGSKVPREIGAIVDEFIVMEFLDFGDGKPPTRAFVCSSPNRWGFPSKDRSGRLEQIEEPHLGKLIAKITDTDPRKPFISTTLTKEQDHGL
jgi:hypothetical protein